MKNYRRWWHAAGYKKQTMLSIPADITKLYRRGTEDGWRAGVEWAKNHEECDFQGCQYMIDELENE